MDVRQAYNRWADQYDNNRNRTRDLEAIALRESLTLITYERCLEIGCGTGKNMAWLAGKARYVTAADLSDEMLAKAKEKIKRDNVQFRQADITESWTFVDGPYDLLTFSLVLEHIQNLNEIFRKAAQAVVRNGYVYIGELHPFKQYSGTKARFDTGAGQEVLTCFTHHVSDFTQAAREHGLGIVSLQEYFDDGDRTGIPRILTLILQKE